MPKPTNLELLETALRQVSDMGLRGSAEALEVSHATISTWLQAQKDGGLQAVADKIQHKTRAKLLAKTQGVPVGDSPTYGDGVRYVTDRLSALVDELAQVTKQSQAPGPNPRAGDEPVGPETLRERFLAAIHPYNALEVERFCGLNHETVRQYKKEWPERGPTEATKEKMRVMIHISDAMDLQDSIIKDKKVPPRANGLITIAEGLRADPEIVKKGPNLGWITVADAFADLWRDMNLRTIIDEFAWLGYKRGLHYDPDTASKLTPEDVALELDDTLPGDAE